MSSRFETVCSTTAKFGPSGRWDLASVARNQENDVARWQVGSEISGRAPPSADGGFDFEDALCDRRCPIPLEKHGYLHPSDFAVLAVSHIFENHLSSCLYQVWYASRKQLVQSLFIPPFLRIRHPLRVQVPPRDRRSCIPAAIKSPALLLLVAIPSRGSPQLDPFSQPGNGLNSSYGDLLYTCPFAHLSRKFPTCTISSPRRPTRVPLFHQPGTARTLSFTKCTPGGIPRTTIPGGVVAYGLRGGT